ncbi:hypothetical protein MTP99_004948 [Tenebrio molitor]|nr:hypothetical protein MTP99_004948 [Tenebrio molitor]
MMLISIRPGTLSNTGSGRDLDGRPQEGPVSFGERSVATVETRCLFRGSRSSPERRKRGRHWIGEFVCTG